MPATGKPRRPAQPATHVIVHRPTGCVVSRHPSLADARESWRRRAFPTEGLVKLDIGSWGHTHMILPAGAAETAARRRAAELAKRKPA